MPISKIILTGTDHLSPPAWLLLIVIKGYRLVVSPVFNLFTQCRHYPTCSQYGLDAVRKYGAVKGAWMTAKRVARCNPWHPGGYDPVE